MPDEVNKKHVILKVIAGSLLVAALCLIAMIWLDLSVDISAVMFKLFLTALVSMGASAIYGVADYIILGKPGEGKKDGTSSS